MTRDRKPSAPKHTHHVSFGRTYRADCPACKAKTAAYLAPSSESQPRVVAECWTCPAPELFSQVIATDRCRAAGHDVREVKA